MGETRDPGDRERGSIEDFAARRLKQREAEEREPSLITLEVRQRGDLEDPFLVGALRLSGDMPVKKDLNAGEQVTVQVAGADGDVIASGLFEIGLPAFKYVKMGGVGIIGTERVHTAKFLPGE